MPLILAIEPDKRQGNQLASLVKGLHAELVLRTNAADAVAALHGRVPDLVLTTSLISPRDDAALGMHLRELGSAAAHVQTVTIPLLGLAAPQRAKGGMLAALRREKPQASMTDGCEPEVFAEQVRQYLATAEEQKVSAATRAVAADAVAEAAVADAAVSDDTVAEMTVAADEFLTPATEPEPVVFEPEPVVELAAAEPETSYEAPVYAESIAEPIEQPIEEPAVVAEIEMAAAAPEADEFVVDEPAGMPLSQLLQLVSDAAPAIVKPVIEAPAIEAPAIEAPAIEAPVAMAPEEELAAIAEPYVEPEPQPVASFDDLYVDPIAAEALDELSLQAPPPALPDGIPGEPPVPVVEMHSFQSLDAIASELAAGPAQRHDTLDDLASLFAAPAASVSPAPVPVEPVVDFSAPMHGEKSLFASLFADPAPARAPKPVEISSIEPSLFASPAAEPIIAFEAPAPVTAVEPEPIFAVEPEPVLAVEPEPVVAIEPEPIVAVIEPEPIVTAIEDEPLAAAPVEATEDALITFEPVVFEPVVEEPVAVAAAPALDEEISLDVDAFAFTPPAPAQPSPFSFTLVDGFGDALSDFELPSVAAVATDLGVGEHLPLDPYAARPASAPALSREVLSTPQAAPALDQEALSLIGDAARKMGLDALVIEEFERGLTTPRPKKLKKKVHAGATQVPAPAAPAPKPAKRPVQDEWGMFDPEQCGFAALDEEEGAEPRQTTGTRVRVVSY